MKIRNQFCGLIVLFAFLTLTRPVKGDAFVTLISDLNGPYGSAEYAEEVHLAVEFIMENPPDIVICAGDMIAGQNKSLSAQQLKKMWRGFDLAVIKKLVSANILFAPVFGNHDGSGSAGFIHERNIARTFWNQNRPGLNYIDDTSFPDYYSFVLKKLFFVCIDASTSHLGQEQKMWIEKQLLSKVAQESNFRVVVGHLPLYAVAQGRNRAEDVLSDSENINSLFARANVDCYISGHHHAFYYSQTNGVKHIFSGALGSGPRKYIGSGLKARKSFTTLIFESETRKIRAITYAPAEKMHKINSSDLPAEIKSFNKQLNRIENQLFE